MNWICAVGELLSNAYDLDTIPQVGELDELETFGFAKPPAEGCRNAPAFVGQKKTKFGAPPLLSQRRIDMHRLLDYTGKLLVILNRRKC